MWNDFIASAKNATFLFHRDFMEYHKDRFIDHSLLIFKNDKLVAVLPANKIDASLQSHQGLTYGGLVISKKLKLKEYILLFKELLEYLHQQEISSLVLKELPEFYTQGPSQEIQYVAQLTKAITTRIDTASVIDYRNRLPIQSNRLEGVKKADRQGLVLKEEPAFKTFWEEILGPNLERRHSALPTHTSEEISSLHKISPKNIRQFNVYKGDALVAGATVFETKTTAHIQYISGNEQKQELGSLDFLFYHLIEKVFAHKWYFDFGISNEAQGTKLNSGLSYWKECFGARTKVHRQYNFNTENHHLLNDVLI